MPTTNVIELEGTTVTITPGEGEGVPLILRVGPAFVAGENLGPHLWIEDVDGIFLSVSEEEWTIIRSYIDEKFKKQKR